MRRKPLRYYPRLAIQFPSPPKPKPKKAITVQKTLVGENPLLRKFMGKEYTFYSGATKESVRTYLRLGRVGGKFRTIAFRRTKPYYAKDEVEYDIWRILR